MSKKEMTVQKQEANGEERTTPEKFYLPSTDILEFEDRLVLSMDMPGTSRDEVTINVEDSTLKVGTSFNPSRYDGWTPLYSEYNVGPYTRSFNLSTKIDQERIEAKMELGVLTITLPKKAELIRQISIK